MKNKKEDQIVKKKEHKEFLRRGKRSKISLERNDPSINEKPTILIVCEGRNTEPSYFNKFRLSSATVKSIGEGYNTVSLVNRAKKLADAKSYDQVWCVFDADPRPDDPSQLHRFDSAINLSEKFGFGVAYSNQAFEYWLILHFDDHQGGSMNRADYDKKINSLLKPFDISYDGKKSKVISDEFFEVLDGVDLKTNELRMNLAIKRAKRNFHLFDNVNPSAKESSTTVFRLVEELIKYI